MDIMTRKRMKMVSIVALALLMSVFSSFVPANTDAASPHKYNSGEEIFAGIAFGQGEVGKRLTSIRSKKEIKSANTPEVKATVKKIMNQMKKDNPGYFNELKKATNDEDIVMIEKSLTKGSKIVKKVIGDLNINDSLKQQQRSIRLNEGLSTSLSFLSAMNLPEIGYVIFVGAPSRVSSITINVNNLTQLEKEYLVKQLIT